jgi:hypothetical protein
MPISPLSLEDLALRSVVVEGLYDPELPNSIQIELEKLWMLPGRYRIYHVERKVEREDERAVECRHGLGHAQHECGFLWNVHHHL